MSAARSVRVALLLVVLGAVAAQAWIDRESTTDWDDPLWVGIFPLNADGSDVAERYIASLTEADFAGIADFFAREAHRFGVQIEQPVRIELYPSPSRLPPALPSDAGLLSTMWWSLRLRWYAWQVSDVPGRAPAQIRVFVHYHDPQRSPRVPHSLGLQKGLVGVVHAFADRSMRRSNEIVIAHEVLHTLGATDKYDPETNAPLYPHGYAEPERVPLHPQPRAEIMAGRRARSEGEYEMPESLNQVVVGAVTAAEIRWTRAP